MKRLNVNINVILLSLVLSMVCSCGFMDQDAVQRRHQRIAELDAKITKGLAMKDKLEEFRKEVFKLKEKIRLSEEVLGTRPNVDLLARSIEYLASQCGLSINRFSPLPERNKGFYGEIPARTEFSGSLDALKDFLEKIADEPRIITVSDLELNCTRSGLMNGKCLLTAIWSLEKSSPSPRTAEPTPRAAVSSTPLPKSRAKSHRLRELDETIARKEKQVQELQIIIDQVLKYERDVQILNVKVKMIESMQENPANISAQLRVLDRSIPEDLWITKIKFKDDTVILDGIAEKQGSVGDYMSALEANNLFTEIKLRFVKIDAQNQYAFSMSARFTE